MVYIGSGVAAAEGLKGRFAIESPKSLGIDGIFISDQKAVRLTMDFDA
jgi:hypothetical protein